MDEPPKKYRFWQLHLSTAVLLMLLIAWLAKINIVPSDNFRDHGEYTVTSYGWPIHIIHYDFKGRTDYEGKSNAWDVDDSRVGTLYRSILIAIIENLLVAISLVANVAFLSECLIRRREGRKT